MKAYKDSTPDLSFADSAFESWFQAHYFATYGGSKQISRESYAAGMGDPLVVAATACPILKGTGKIDGDGFKDTTRTGEVVYVWNSELAAPYAPGQFPRVGNQAGWTACRDQYDFEPASVEEVRGLFDAMAGRLADALQVLGMVDKNNRIEAGEKGKAWNGRFVVDEVRRVLGGAST